MGYPLKSGQPFSPYLIGFRRCHVFFCVATRLFVQLVGRVSSRLARWTPGNSGVFPQPPPILRIYMYASEGKAKVGNISSSEKFVFAPLPKSKDMHHVQST